MRIFLSRDKKSVFLVFLLMFFFCGQPAKFGQENFFFHGYPMAKPVIRIALGVNVEDIVVGSSSGMKIYQVDGSYKLLSEDAQTARIRGRRTFLSEKFFVQAAQFKRKDEAEAAARRLRSKIARNVSVVQNPAAPSEIHDVRVGDFLTRGEALEFIHDLAALGFPEAWILREETAVVENHPRSLLVNDQMIGLDGDTQFFFIPASTESYLTYGGRSYRGIFVLRGSRKGLILINILNLEDYLKGVVPGELPPSAFNELEAQKAQAVAARTYGLKNIGQFGDLGFDLYATPVSQVYLGLSAEQALSSQAVEETRGETIVYEGRLIDALYSSTCGGATENVEAVFDGPAKPYLKSTECVAEKESVWTIKSPALFPAVLVGNRNAALRLAYLTALGVIALETSAETWKGPASAAEVLTWSQQASALLGKKAPRAETEAPPLTLPVLARLLIEAFDWKDRVENLMLKAEAEQALASAAGIRPDEKAALAYLVLSGIVPAVSVDNARIVSRAEAALVLDGMLSTYKDLFHQGTVRGQRGETLTLFENGAEREESLQSALFLFRETGGETVPVSSLEVAAGDIVKWVEIDRRICLLERVAASPSNVLDVMSPFHRWQVRMSREELQDRVNLFYPVGKLVDVLPLKRGESKRVIELSVVGQEGQTLMRGLRIRQVLNLRDNLFVVDREYDAEGRVRIFVFTGKGWGHGVGLCQVGAFRMAQKGANYEDILKKYYRGVRIQKAT